MKNISKNLIINKSVKELEALKSDNVKLAKNTVELENIIKGLQVKNQKLESERNKIRREGQDSDLTYQKAIREGIFKQDLHERDLNCLNLKISQLENELLEKSKTAASNEATLNDRIAYLEGQLREERQKWDKLYDELMHSNQNVEKYEINGKIKAF